MGRVLPHDALRGIASERKNNSDSLKQFSETCLEWSMRYFQVVWTTRCYHLLHWTILWNHRLRWARLGQVVSQKKQCKTLFVVAGTKLLMSNHSNNHQPHIYVCCELTTSSAKNFVSSAALWTPRYVPNYPSNILSDLRVQEPQNRLLTSTDGLQIHGAPTE